MLQPSCLVTAAMVPSAKSRASSAFSAAMSLAADLRFGPRLPVGVFRGRRGFRVQVGTGGPDPGLQAGPEPVDHGVGDLLFPGHLVQAGQPRFRKAQPGDGLLVAGAAGPGVRLVRTPASRASGSRVKPCTTSEITMAVTASTSTRSRRGSGVPAFVVSGIDSVAASGTTPRVPHPTRSPRRLRPGRARRVAAPAWASADSGKTHANWTAISVPVTASAAVSTTARWDPWRGPASGVPGRSG